MIFELLCNTFSLTSLYGKLSQQKQFCFLICEFFRPLLLVFSSTILICWRKFIFSFFIGPRLKTSVGNKHTQGTKVRNCVHTLRTIVCTGYTVTHFDIFCLMEILDIEGVCASARTVHCYSRIVTSHSYERSCHVLNLVYCE